jgi:S-adenosylmethionine hydrolase
MSSTFHGRDLFAPVAGHLSRGVPVDRVGSKVTDWVKLEVKAASRQRDGASGTVVQVDYYGNVLTNIPASWMEGAPLGTKYDLCVGEKRTPVTWNRTYSDVPKGDWVALRNASGQIEIARNLDNAASTLSLGVGDEIAIRVPK